jgi:hypothetical protein
LIMNKPFLDFGILYANNTAGACGQRLPTLETPWRLG